MRLYDDSSINGVGKHSGGFMYRSEFKKRSDLNSSKKKSALLPGSNEFWDYDPLELNDLDLNLLNRSLVKYLPTDSLRLELLLERSEKQLEKVNEEIIAAKLLNLTDRDDFLEEKRKSIINRIGTYRAEYRSLGVLYMPADILAGLIMKLKMFFRFIKNLIFSLPFTVVILNKIPGYKEKQRLKKMRLLENKLKREFNKRAKTDYEQLENLFIRKEQLS